MVSRFLKFLNKDVTTMNQAAFVLAVFSVASQLCGLVRDRLLASLVGPSAALDTYYAAFRIPDFVYNSFGVLFSLTVLIPFITQYMEEEKLTGKSHALKNFLNTVFTVFAVGMIVISLVLFVFMPLLTHLTAPGFDEASRHTLVLYSRIMLISPFFFGLSSLLSSFAQVQKKFFSFAVAPLFYNIGILVGILVFRQWWGMLGVVLGVVMGAVLYFLVQVPTLVALGKIPRFTRAIDWQLIRRIMRLSIPRTLGSSLSNLTFIAMGAIASLLAVGSISVFQLSYNIENTPLLVIGISYAVAAFPMMSKLFAEGNKTELLSVLDSAVRNIAFLAIPALLLMIVLRAHIVRVLLGAGAFSWNDTRLVAAAVGLFAVSIVAQCIVLLMVRAFYAIGETRVPLRINLWSFLVTLTTTGLLLVFYRESSLFRDFMQSLMRIDGVEGSSVIMLALGFSMGQIFNAIALWWRFARRMHGARELHRATARAISHMLAAGIISGAATYGTLQLIGVGVDQSKVIGVFIQAMIAGIIGLATYGIVLKALGNQDIELFISTLRSRFWKQRPVVVPQQQDL
jgi:putative peptidoglycan lipid II flippase